MGIKICDTGGITDLSNPCIRANWSALFPAVLVATLCVISLPYPEPIRKAGRYITLPFTQNLTLEEAEALDAKEAGVDHPDADTVPPTPRWRKFVFSSISLVQTIVWAGLGASILLTKKHSAWDIAPALVFAATWLYATARSLIVPMPKPPMDLFTLGLLQLAGAILLVGGVIYDNLVLQLPLPSTVILAALSVNLVSIITILLIIISIPLATPSAYVNKDEIGNKVSPEDYVPIHNWMTFSWVWPLVVKGTDRTLKEDDVWNLSPTLQSRPLFIKFSAIVRSTTLRRLFAANRMDIILDFFLTIVSVAFTYASPFFLKRILDLINRPDASREDRAKAYIYAFLTFACTLLKAQSDVLHLWFGRRASTRIRSELMAAIYDKALKRKDFSGIIDKDKQAEAKEKKEEKEAKAKAALPGAVPKDKKEVKADKQKAKEKAEKKHEAKGGADVGKIVNLMAGDVNRVSMITSAVYYLYAAPFEIIFASAMLYQLLGSSAFAGFSVILVGWPLNKIIAGRMFKISKATAVARDKRMSVINELVSSIKFIKFFAWESKWIQRALDARAEELKWLTKSRINSIMFMMLWNTSPILVSIISFFAYIYFGNQLDVATAFTAIALFGMIRAPLNVIPTWYVQILQTLIALERIDVYLGEDEVSTQVSVLKPSTEPLPSESGLGIENGTFEWNKVVEKPKDDPKAKGKAANHSQASSAASITSEAATVVEGEDAELDHKFELRDINVLFPEGELSVITGPTASGKTALLMALLGELTTTGGRIIMSKNPSKLDKHGLMHSISYAAQSPWLRHQSIRDNILFGYPYDEERYNQVVECCALKPDLDVFEDGDQTEIGVRGVSLSGGQKARVALARAVYARTKYVLLDDPLSAVDSHTARFLFERLFQGPLFKHRTVILVTHHVGLVLPGAHFLVRMLDGRIDTQGTTKELRAQGILDEIAHEAKLEAHEETTVEASEEPKAAEVDLAKDGEPAKKPRKLVEDEHREEGGVKWSIYKAYLRASSYWTWATLLFIIIVTQFRDLGEKLWIRTWGEAYGPGNGTSLSTLSFGSPIYSEHQTVLSRSSGQYSFTAPVSFGYELPSPYEHPLFYVAVYAGFGLAATILNLLGATSLITGSLMASRTLFRDLLHSVVHATMRWHDTTPQGRMLNRFGKDFETIDSSLAFSLESVNDQFAAFFASVLTVTYFFPWFIVPAICLGFIYRVLAVGYLNCGRDLKRMESNTKSPIYSGFTELLEGIVTVRAFSAEKRFLDELHGKIDLTTKFWWTYWMLNRWLLLNYDGLGAVAVLITTLSSLAGFVSAGTAGLCITSAMAFTTSVYWACRSWTSLELDFNSVERVVEYLNLPQEPPAIIESNRPPAYWPSNTTTNPMISVEDLVVKYSPELPPVLHGISFDLKAGERVGLLGRTGSGKSTLAMSILRFTDPASGRIFIDGIDITSIGIQDLRSRLTFIPQDATLFSGTLRDNLDPFNEHEDSECLDVLYRVQIMTPPESQSTSRATSRPASITGVEREITTDTASTLTTGTESDTKTVVSLDTQVSAGGTNFSQGQRQLIAMARALLRRSSVIVLDEATSSIDFETDTKIQLTIREEFTNSLLLTVAHRLRTVIDYDRLLVLDQGKIAEFDTPWNLIQKEDGIFRGMCLKSGTYAELEDAARAKAERENLI